MDSQFNTLIRSYHDNFLEHKVTGESKYKVAYLSAQEGIESILKTMSGEVQETQIGISEFYKSGVRDNLRELKESLSEQNDIGIAAKKRQEQIDLNTSHRSLTWHYVGLGVLTAATLGTLFL